MPSWNIHFKIGKELNKKLNIDQDAFLFGSVLPDTDYDWNVKRFQAHYYGRLKFPLCPQENKIDLDTFINDYREHLDDPLIIGYLCHLLADNYFNEYIYYKKWVLDNHNNIIGVNTNNGVIKTDDYKTILGYKHKDLELYGKRLMKEEMIPLPEDSYQIYESADYLKNSFINPLQIISRIDYLNDGFIDFNQMSEEELNKGYLLFTKEEIDNLVKGCIVHIINKLSELGIYKEQERRGR